MSGAASLQRGLQKGGKLLEGRAKSFLGKGVSMGSGGGSGQSEHSNSDSSNGSKGSSDKYNFDQQAKSFAREDKNFQSILEMNDKNQVLGDFVESYVEDEGAELAGRGRRSAPTTGSLMSTLAHNPTSYNLSLVKLIKSLKSKSTSKEEKSNAYSALKKVCREANPGLARALEMDLMAFNESNKWIKAAEIKAIFAAAELMD